MVQTHVVRRAMPLLLAMLVVRGGVLGAVAADEQPQRLQMYPVGPDTIALRIQEGRVERSRIVPYAPQPADEIRAESYENIPMARRVYRDGVYLGALVGQADDAIVLADRYSGEALDTTAADRTETYRLTSGTDEQYESAVRPLVVSRKSKPNQFCRSEQKLGVLHTVYLRWPSPLKSGATYTLDCGPLNATARSWTYRHSPETTTSEAVHVNQNGFAPGDAVKRAYVSLWMGPAGGMSWPGPMRFDVIDALTGRSVFRGSSETVWPADRPELMERPANLVGADVWRLDFPQVTRPGRYYVRVDGLGCSVAFDISPAVWERAVRTSLRGVFHHRSGIELGPPYTDFWRPRPFHPDDGVVVRQSRASLLGTSMGPGFTGPDSFAALVREGTDETLPHAWGGMMDAGDWDRRAQHLSVPRLLTEMFELNPAYFAGLDLNIPESGDAMPDILDEGLWILDFYLRMQSQEGGVSGGVESAAHPAAGDVSWTESLPVFAYAPDFWSTHEFVSAAAKAAVVLRELHPQRAETYAAAALRGMGWAEARYAEALAKKDAGLPWTELIDARNLAAIELYRLTGDARWHRVFLEDCVLAARDVPTPEGRQRDALFSYARLAPDQGDPALRQRAREVLVADADACLAYAKDNAFSLAAPSRKRPLFIGFLAGPVDSAALVRGHALTGDMRYRDALLAASHYGFGANPDNLSYTTGVGSAWPQWVLHEDSLKTGRLAPEGITVYGPFDHRAEWVTEGSWWLQPLRDFHLNEGRMFPQFQQWPAHESYVDMWNFIAQNEYTPWQTMVPPAYGWGYLAALTAGGRMLP